MFILLLACTVLTLEYYTVDGLEKNFWQLTHYIISFHRNQGKTEVSKYNANNLNYFSIARYRIPIFLFWVFQPMALKHSFKNVLYPLPKSLASFLSDLMIWALLASLQQFCSIGLLFSSCMKHPCNEQDN